jgi:cytochrome P450
MSTVNITSFEDASAVLRDEHMKQALYEEGAVIMDSVLLTLHGQEHRKRRALEFRIFRRDVFRYYETEVFPATLRETIAPMLAAGRADLVDLGYRVTMNLTADFAGIDRPLHTPEETQTLLRMVMLFSEGATLVHSKRDKEEVRAEIRGQLQVMDAVFLKPSIERRQALLRKFAAGEITEDKLPKDVLTVLLRNEDKLELPPDILRREIAFYLQAGSHSTANSTTHALHNAFIWCEKHPDDRAKLLGDPLFLQRCVHESFRLHPASPVAWRRPVCPVSLRNGDAVTPSDLVVADLHAANRDKSIFGPDADEFNPYRVIPAGYMPFGLTFGTGVHSCIGRDLDGGVVPKRDTDAATHQYGIVTLLIRRLLEIGAQRDPNDPPELAKTTERIVWGRYPLIFTGKA